RVRHFVLRSDGALMVQVLRRGGLEPTTRDLAGMSAGLRELWAAVGDVLAPRAFLLGAASGWLALDGAEPAQQAVEEAEALPGPLPPWLEAYQVCVAGWVASASGELERAGEDLQTAERLFAAQGNGGGLFLVSLARIDLLHARGDDVTAVA